MDNPENKGDAIPDITPSELPRSLSSSLLLAGWTISKSTIENYIPEIKTFRLPEKYGAHTIGIYSGAFHKSVIVGAIKSSEHFKFPVFVLEDSYINQIIERKLYEVYVTGVIVIDKNRVKKVVDYKVDDFAGLIYRTITDDLRVERLDVDIPLTDSSTTEEKERQAEKEPQVQKNATKKDENRTPKPAPLPSQDDSVPLHLDHPARADELERGPFAESVAGRIREVWRENSGRADGASFVIHLHGAWGSGKSTFFNLVRDHLKAEPDPESGDWVTVTFNAWQHQRVSPPWWFLMDTLYRQAMPQLMTPWAARPVLAVREWWWRMRATRTPTLIAIALAGLALLGAMEVFDLEGALKKTEGGSGLFDPETASKVVKYLTGMVTAVFAAWAAFAKVGSSLLPGSAQSAQAFLEMTRDPMGLVQRHYRHLVGWIGQPILIFIDDLDRCDREHAVQVLEGIQTLFRDPRVVFLVAADRRWLVTAFEKSYEDFAGAAQTPGRPLGYLFLEKAFQLSVTLPPLTGRAVRTYWTKLLGQAPAGPEVPPEAKEAERRIEEAESEEAVLEAAQHEDWDEAVLFHARRAAVRRLGADAVARSTDHFLTAFAPLLEPNPRSMKRLVNAYRLVRDIVLLTTDLQVDRTARIRLALWTIVALRWPLYQEVLEANPKWVDAIAKGGKKPKGVPAEHAHLFTDTDLGKTLSGGDLGTALDTATVEALAGLHGGESMGTVVA